MSSLLDRGIAIVTAGFLAAHAVPGLAITGGASVEEVLAMQATSAFEEQQVAIANAVSVVTVPLIMLDAAGRPVTFCSATIVHPRVLLTAGHCVIHGGEVQRRFVVLFENGSSVPARRQTLDVSVHPAYLGAALGGASRPITEYRKKTLNQRGEESLTNDLALVLLHRPIPETHAVVPIVRSGFRDDLGIHKVIAGYGRVNATATGGRLDLRFADIRGNTQNLRGAAGGGDEIVMESRYQRGGKVNVCSGDSGGPIFALDRDGTGLKQIAVTAGADVHCREESVYAPIDAQRATLRQMFNTLMQGEQGAERNPF